MSHPPNFDYSFNYDNENPENNPNNPLTETEYLKSDDISPPPPYYETPVQNYITPESQLPTQYEHQNKDNQYSTNPNDMNHIEQTHVQGYNMNYHQINNGPYGTYPQNEPYSPNYTNQPYSPQPEQIPPNYQQPNPYPQPHPGHPPHYQQPYNPNPHQPPHPHPSHPHNNNRHRVVPLVTPRYKTILEDEFCGCLEAPHICLASLFFPLCINGSTHSRIGGSFCIGCCFYPCCCGCQRSQITTLLSGKDDGCLVNCFIHCVCRPLALTQEYRAVSNWFISRYSNGPVPTVIIMA